MVIFILELWKEIFRIQKPVVLSATASTQLLIRNITKYYAWHVFRNFQKYISVNGAGKETLKFLKTVTTRAAVNAMVPLIGEEMTNVDAEAFSY